MSKPYSLLPNFEEWLLVNIFVASCRNASCAKFHTHYCFKMQTVITVCPAVLGLFAGNCSTQLGRLK